MVDRQFPAITQTRSGTHTQVSEDFEVTSNGFKSVSKTVIPYARSKVITFTATSLKPFTKLYIYFDKKEVNKHVTPASSGAIGTTFGNFSTVANPVAGSILISDGVGNCNGTFKIPNPQKSGNPKFPTGDLSFVITADPNNRQVGDGANEIVSKETSAEAMYSAKGMLDTQQETIISTRNAIVKTTGLSENSGTILGAVLPLPAPPFVEADQGDMDPLAQTFIVLDTNSADGITGAFLTSCDIFFFQKDPNYPVTMEIRNCLNAEPGPKILPFGRKTLQSGEVSTSTDGNTATTFTFDSPVYVKGGTEYAICLLANTPDYKVWISDLGTQDTAGNEITDQPHVGVIFKSSNNRTWSPSQTQDLKFSMKRAKFDTSAAGLVTLQNKELPTTNLKSNPLEMTDNNLALKVNHAGHGMFDVENNVTISKVESGAETTLNGALSSSATSITLTSGTNFDDTTGKYSLDASSNYYIIIDDEIISYDTISTNTISSATRGANSTTAVSHADGTKVQLYQIHKVPLFHINKTHTGIANIQQDSYTIVLAMPGSTKPNINSNDGSTATFGGKQANATENAQYDVSTTNIGMMTPTRTKIDAGFLATSGTSPSGSETSFTESTTSRIVPLDDNYYWESTNLVASGINETNEMGGTKSLKVPLTMTSEIDALSPVLDLQRASMLAVSNQINQIDSSSDVYPTDIYKSMVEPDGDNHAAIYLTKKIDLANPATSLRVILDAVRSPDSSIKILFKTLRVDDEFDFSEMGFRFFNDDGTVSGSGGPDVTTRPSESRGEYIEHEYTAGVTDDGIGSPLEEFISFQIKIVMRSTNQALPPLIRQLRVLALAT